MQYKSAESKEKIKSKLNTVWITNGIDSKQISKNLQIPDGWYKGRINSWNKNRKKE